MADSKTSALPAATTPLAGTEVLPVVQGGATDQVSVANLTAGRDVSVKKLNATDNVVIGTAGKGIDFSANTHAPGMTSELLNDYEEGTWTPTLSTNGFSGGVTLSSATGTYTKIGRQVTLQCNLNLSNFAYPSALVEISGLPYTPDARSAGSYMGAHPAGGNMGGACGVANGGTVIYAPPSLGTETSTVWTFTITYFV